MYYEECKRALFLHFGFALYCFFQNKNISVLINDGIIFFVRRIFVCIVV